MACFHSKQSVEVVFIFSSKTSVLVWCGLKQAENEPKTTHVFEYSLSLAENPSIQKRAYSAGFQAENSPTKNPSTGLNDSNPDPDPPPYHPKLSNIFKNVLKIEQI